MKASELMIMDWVLLDGTPIQVAGLHNRKVGVHKRRRSIYCSWHSYGEFRPIPLTEEILLKNGFDKDKRSKYFHIYTLDMEGHWDFDISWSSQNGFSYEDIKLAYVHQLQHLLRLVGVQKEIEL